MKISNPLAAEDLDMQDIRGDHYATMKPASTILRLEGLAYLLLACALYQSLGFAWGQFALWFLLPDVALLVYVLGNPRAGMWAYNLTHSSAGAGLVGVVGVLTAQPVLWQASLIWFAHIGFDRALGYGLKFPLGFRVTHLGVIGGMRRSDGT
ncbi:MAG: DUF4260 family protein [Acidovorax sp.]